MNEPVSREQLLDALWEDAPPKTATKTIQVFVSRARKALEDDPHRPRALITSGDGYLLRAEPGSVDVHEFKRRLAARKFREALALWRGPALADLRDNQFLRSAAEALDELRLTALEERVDADTAAGMGAELVPELEQLTKEHPLRERARAHLMVALYRAGRQADALEVCRDARVRLKQAGLEPTSIIRDVERAILRQDPSLAAASAPEPPAILDVRKPVVALVAELADADEADPEAVAAFAERWLPEAAATVEYHGGTFHRVLDGSAVAIFGFPTAHEDDAMRAVRAADELRAELARVKRGSISARIGIAAGEMLVSQRLDGSPLAATPVRKAAKLARLASRGEVVLSDEVRERISAPRAIRLDAPLIGRSDELHRLERLTERAACERRCVLATIVGEPGVGKSRLAWGLAEAANAATSLFGQCPPYGEAITLWPLGEIVEQAAGGKNASEISRLLSDEPDAAAIAERIAGALGAGAMASDAADTLWAFRRFFQGLGRKGPVIAVLDDLHWAEPALLTLIASLAEGVRDSAVVLLCSSREPMPALEDAASASIVLEPLDDAASSTLFDCIRSSPAAMSSKERLLRAAGGNPLFLEQMLAHGTEAPTLKSLLAMRLDALESNERELLGRAAVIGTEFRRDALLALVPRASSGKALRIVEKLIKRGFLAAKGETMAGHPLYRFRHGLIRDAAYHAITKQTRSELHERFAEWVAHRFSRSTRAYEQLLGYHLEQAYRLGVEAGAAGKRQDDLAGAAAERLGKAASFALDRNDFSAAVNLLRRAADLLPAADANRIDLLFELVDALRQMGAYDEAEEVLEAARSGARGVDDPNLEMYAELVEMQLRIQTDETITPVEIGSVAAAAVAVFEESNDPRRAARAWFVRALDPWFGSRCGEAQEALERAVRFARAAGDRSTERNALALLFGAIYQGPVPVPVGVARCEQLLASRMGDRRLEATAYRALGAFKAMLGEFAEAREFVARDQAILNDLGLKPANGVAAWVRAQVELLAGNPGGAEKVLRWGYQILLDIGDVCRSATLTAHMAEALFRQERFEEAIEWIERCREQVTPDDTDPEVVWRSVQARIHARAGEVDAAQALAREAVAIAERTDFPILHADAWGALGEVLALTGSRAEARAAYVKSQAHYKRKGDVVSAARLAERVRALGRRPRSPTSAAR